MSIIRSVRQPFPGDLNGDGLLDEGDIQTLCSVYGRQTDFGDADLDGDGVVGRGDLRRLVIEFLGTTIGDADLDGVFNSSDLVDVFIAGEFEDQKIGNSTWSTGDWNCDGEFGTGDLVDAFQEGGYSVASLPVAVVAGFDPWLASTNDREKDRILGNDSDEFGDPLLVINSQKEYGRKAIIDYVFQEHETRPFETAPRNRLPHEMTE